MANKINELYRYFHRRSDYGIPLCRHASLQSVQALMLMITVMQIPEKEKNRKILKAVRVSTAVLWLLTCIEDVVLMIRKNYN